MLDTIEMMRAQEPPVAEILVMDQTPKHRQETERQLEVWHESGDIRWFRLEKPSQPGALNEAIRQSTQPFLIFVDDDIRIAPDFAAAHIGAFERDDIWAVAGQVLQPGEKEDVDYRHVAQHGSLADVNFPFRSAHRCLIQNGMSGNLCVRRDRALEIGGFDENFIPPVSYRFDNEFCKRLVRAGGQIVFVPEARIHHLRASSGGTRTSGSHLVSASPQHGVGDYYFALRCASGLDKFWYIFKRPWREVRTRFHLRHPWWAPVKFYGELRALALALKLNRQGPRLIVWRESRFEDLARSKPARSST